MLRNRLAGKLPKTIKRFRGKFLSPSYRKLSTVIKRFRGKFLDPIRHRLSKNVKRLRIKFLSPSYQRWIERNSPETSDLSLIADAEKPISVLLPVYRLGSGERWKLRQSIRSVLAQHYPQWQLCVASDVSSASGVQSVLKTLGCADHRVTITVCKQNNEATVANAALSLATGEFMALLACGDEMAPNALYEAVRHLQKSPKTDFIYTDEDRITRGGKRKHPFFKPDWSPDYFQAYPEACCSGIYRTALVRQLEGFRDRYSGAYSWDLSLRAAEQANGIHHIAKVLYHRRTRFGPGHVGFDSVTKGDRSGKISQQVLQSAIDRSDYPGSVERLSKRPLLFRVRRHIVDEPLVSILIPSAGVCLDIKGNRTCLLVQCINSIRQLSTYQNIEIIVVDGKDISTETIAAIKGDDLTVVHDNRPFNFSARMNLAAQSASGDILLMLNDDIEVITPDWIESMLGLAQQKNIGVVGAKLLYPNQRLQHAGVLVLAGIPTHAFHRGRSTQKGYHYSNVVTRNYIGVTGACLMMRRALFEKLSGFDEDFPLNYNDVDLCLRAHQAGYRNVFTPHAALVHYESISRGKKSSPSTIAQLRQKFEGSTFMLNDPYYNPNLSYLRPFFQLAWPEEDQRRNV